MLKEWSDREPDPPLPKGCWLALCASTGIVIVLVGWRIFHFIDAIFS